MNISLQLLHARIKNWPEFERFSTLGVGCVISSCGGAGPGSGGVKAGGPPPIGVKAF